MAVGNVDLSRVNISLTEFQRMSDGKYNAGEVKLSGETGLKKVNNHARQRVALMRKAGTICQSPLSAAMLRRHILVLGRLDKFDFDRFKAEAEKMKSQAEKVAQLIDSNASVDDICNDIGDIFLACKDKVCDIYKKGPLDDVGPDDFFAYGVPMQILAMDAVPGLMNKVQAFFGREDVKALDFNAANGPAANAESLRYALDRATELPVELGDKNI